jgi:hypothetical protein
MRVGRRATNVVSRGRLATGVRAVSDAHALYQVLVGCFELRYVAASDQVPSGTAVVYHDNSSPWPVDTMSIRDIVEASKRDPLMGAMK